MRAIVRLVFDNGEQRHSVDPGKAYKLAVNELLVAVHDNLPYTIGHPGHRLLQDAFDVMATADLSYEQRLADARRLWREFLASYGTDSLGSARPHPGVLLDVAVEDPHPLLDVAVEDPHTPRTTGSVEHYDELLRGLKRGRRRVPDPSAPCDPPDDPEWPAPVNNREVARLLARLPPGAVVLCAATAIEMVHRVLMARPETSVSAEYGPQLLAGLRPVYGWLGGEAIPADELIEAMDVLATSIAGRDVDSLAWRRLARAAAHTLDSIPTVGYPNDRLGFGAFAVGEAASIMERLGAVRAQFLKRWWQLCRCRLGMVSPSIETGSTTEELVPGELGTADAVFDAADGLYWYLSEHHAGQSSDAYEMLSRLDYRPGANEGPPTERPDERFGALQWYERLERGLAPERLFAAIQSAWARRQRYEDRDVGLD